MRIINDLIEKNRWFTWSYIHLERCFGVLYRILRVLLEKIGILLRKILL